MAKYRNVIVADRPDVLKSICQNSNLTLNQSNLNVVGFYIDISSPPPTNPDSNYKKAKKKQGYVNCNLNQLSKTVFK